MRGGVNSGDMDWGPRPAGVADREGGAEGWLAARRGVDARATSTCLP
jgi:hypothetical protein